MAGYQIAFRKRRCREEPERPLLDASAGLACPRLGGSLALVILEGLPDAFHQIRVAAVLFTGSSQSICLSLRKLISSSLVFRAPAQKTTWPAHRPMRLSILVNDSTSWFFFCAGVQSMAVRVSQSQGVTPSRPFLWRLFSPRLNEALGSCPFSELDFKELPAGCAPG